MNLDLDDGFFNYYPFHKILHSIVVNNLSRNLELDKINTCTVFHTVQNDINISIHINSKKIQYISFKIIRTRQTCQNVIVPGKHNNATVGKSSLESVPRDQCMREDLNRKEMISKFPKLISV